MTTSIQNKWSLANDAIKSTFTPGIAEEFGQWMGANIRLEPQTTLLDKIQQFFLQKNISLSLDDSNQILEGINMETSNTNKTKPEDLQGLLTNHKVLKMGTEAKEEIGLLQDALRKLGYEIDDQNGKYRGIFGEQTENAVKDFQANQGLNADGIVGQQTLAVLMKRADMPASSKIAKAVISYKDASAMENVPECLKNVLNGKERLSLYTTNKEGTAFIQDKLRQLNFVIDDKNGKYRGVYGPSTKTAIKYFQRGHNLPQTGEVDSKTLKALLTTKDYIPEDVERKPGTITFGLKPEIKKTIPVIIEVYKKFGLPTPVLTSGVDSNHSKDSLHYKNLAIDLRGNTMTNKMMRAVAAELQKQLGTKYDVGAEFFDDPDNDHIHVEYDPR